MKLFLLCLILPFISQAQNPSAKAEGLFKSGKNAESKLLYKQIYSSNHSDLQAIERLGDIMSNVKVWDSAAYYYKKLTVIKPAVADYHYKYGGATGMHAKECNNFVALGMISEIRESFERAISLNPKHVEARWALIELYLNLPGIVGGSERKAAGYATQLLKISPVDGVLAQGRIAEYFSRYTVAEKHYKAAIEIGGSRNSYLKLAGLYRNKMNMPEKAKAIMEAYSKKNKS